MRGDPDRTSAVGVRGEVELAICVRLRREGVSKVTFSASAARCCGRLAHSTAPSPGAHPELCRTEDGVVAAAHSADVGARVVPVEAEHIVHAAGGLFATRVKGGANAARRVPPRADARSRSTRSCKPHLCRTAGCRTRPPRRQKRGQPDLRSTCHRAAQSSQSCSTSGWRPRSLPYSPEAVGERAVWVAVKVAEVAREVAMGLAAAAAETAEATAAGR